MQGSVIQEGLWEHAWNDAQLTKLDNMLGDFDVLDSGQFWMRGEIIFYSLPISEYYEENRWVSLDKLSELKGKVMTDESKPSELERITFWLTPQGWVRMDMAAWVSFRLHEAAIVIDPVARRVYPDKQQELLRSVKGKHSQIFWSDPQIEPDSSQSRSVRTFAFGQVLLDEARIACRLERYRLAHGTYPDSLDALVPAYGSEFPRDVMCGAPYHYKLNSDGTYLLYSVGWNQLDDQGDATIPPGESRQNAPDWVWPSHSDLPKAK
jgi:hypothetical protein